MAKRKQKLTPVEEYLASGGAFKEVDRGGVKAKRPQAPADTNDKAWRKYRTANAAKNRPPGVE